MLEQARMLGSGHESSAFANVSLPGRPRLLVIDDDNLHRMILCRAGAKAGYAPAGAATYEEAVNLTQKNAFDCITLDLSLGPHGGFEMLQHLWVTGCKAPIIIVSGCDSATCNEAEKFAKSLKLTIWQTIPKPVDLAVLRFWLERLRTQQDAAAAAA